MNHTTHKTFAIARIIKIKEKPLGDLTEKDKQDHEKFKDDEEMYKVYSDYYDRPVDKDTPVKLIWFGLLEQLI